MRRLAAGVVAVGVMTVSTVISEAGAEVVKRSPAIEMEVVGSWNNYQLTIPTGINERGHVVGYGGGTGTMFGYDAFLWTRDGGFQLIAADAIALGINDRGDVVGQQFECTPFPEGNGWSCSPRGFVWNVQGGLRSLGDFWPRAINDAGDMAGECPSRGSLAACAILGGVRVEWPCNLEDCGQVAAGINERGDVVGTRSAMDTGDTALLFRRDRQPVVLSPGTAEDLNNAGIVVGRAPSTVWPSNATMWTRDGFEQLPVPATSVAVAINSRGWAVGLEFGDGCYCNRAFLWDGQSEPRYLARDASSSQASDINNHGTIIGFVTWNSPVHEFVIWQGRD